MQHTCSGTILENLSIRKAEHFSYWIMEWNYQDENDPCYGNLTIQYCPFCGEKLGEKEQCEVNGCHNPDEYEGWWRAKDFAGLDTGLIQRRKVCEVHKTMLIGA